jgi:predicted SAM-dependent methyltransferase
MIKLHLGCGPVIKDGFINYDLNPGNGGVRHDLTTPLPHENNTVDFIFSEHFIEHITREQGLKLLKECFRVLKPGCTLRIATPNLSIIVNDYINRTMSRYGKEFDVSPSKFLNRSMRDWGHQFVFDTEELVMLFNEAGFKSVSEVEHGKYEARGYFCEVVLEGIKQ